MQTVWQYAPRPSARRAIPRGVGRHTGCGRVFAQQIRAFGFEIGGRRGYSKNRSQRGLPGYGLFGLRRGGGAGIGGQAKFCQFVLRKGIRAENFLAASIQGIKLIVERSGGAEWTASGRVAKGKFGAGVFGLGPGCEPVFDVSEAVEEHSSSGR